MSLSLQTLKDMFDKVVSVEHITYEWDGGHCYSSIEHPLMEVAEHELESEDERDQWYDYTNSWLSEHEEARYNEPTLIDLDGNLRQSTIPEDRDVNSVSNVEGFIDLVENHSSLDPQERAKLAEMYHVPQLKEWVRLQKESAKFDEELGETLSEEKSND